MVFDITIAISSYNRDNKVLQTVQRLLESNLEKFNRVELIIIDDGSPKPVKELIESIRHVPEKIDIKIITQQNAGIGATRNRGYREAQSNVVLFLDDDILVDNYTVENIFLAQQEKSGAIIFGSYPFITHQSVALQKFASKLFGYDLITAEKKFEKVDAITSGLLCVDKSKLGNMPNFYKDTLTIPAAEEHEIIYRFHKMQIPIYHAHHISAIHNHHLELKWLGVQQYKYGLATAEAFSKNPEITEMQKFSTLSQSLDTKGKSFFKNMIRSFLSSLPGRRSLSLFAKTLVFLFPNKNHDFIFGLFTSASFFAGYKAGQKRFRR